MAVEVGEAERRAERVAGPGQRAGQLGAAAAEQERALARGERGGDGGADRGRARQHVGARHQAGRRIALLAADPHREVALVAGAERLGQAEFAQRRRARSRCAGAADRIEGHADRHRRFHPAEPGKLSGDGEAQEAKPKRGREKAPTVPTPIRRATC